MHNEDIKSLIKEILSGFDADGRNTHGTTHHSFGTYLVGKGNFYVEYDNFDDAFVLVATDTSDTALNWQILTVTTSDVDTLVASVDLAFAVLKE